MIQEIYMRDNSTNYMTIESEGKPGEENYQIKMLLKNSVAKFLPINIRSINNRQIYCYDISSKQPLSRMYEGNNIKRDDVINITMHISQIVSVVSEYLLELDSVILNARFMYMNISDKSLYFTYYPYADKNFIESLRELFEFILEHLDHNDKKAVMLTYGIYQKILQNDFKLENLAANIEEEDSKNSKSEEVDSKNSKAEKVREKSYIIESVLPETIEEEKEVQDDRIVKIFTAAKVVLILSAIFVGFNMFVPSYRVMKVNLLPGIIVMALVCAAYKILDVIYENNKKYFIKIVKNRSQIEYQVLEENIETSAEQEQPSMVEDKNRRVIRTVPTDKVSRQDAGRQNASSQNASRQGDIGQDASQEKKHKNNQENSDYAPTQLLSNYLKETETAVNCRLVAQDDFCEEKEIVIMESPFIIGSLSNNCNFSIGSKLISRMHVRLTREKGNKSYFVEDLNSTNGTFVNGNRISPNEKVEIGDGDILKIAVMQFRFWTE